jgi:hypothetical protein
MLLMNKTAQKQVYGWNLCTGLCVTYDGAQCPVVSNLHLSRIYSQALVLLFS